jgi:general secretion pathway protein L
MSDILVLALPHTADLAAAARDGRRCDGPYWAHIAGGRMLSSGEGDGWRGVRDQWVGAARDDGTARSGDRLRSGDVLRYAALAPAMDAPVRFCTYADALPAQAATAARLDVQQQILGAPDQQHVVAGLPSRTGEAFPVAVTSQRAMALWLGWLDEQGIAPHELLSIMPAAALWPEPADGALVGAYLGAQHDGGLPSEQVMRSTSAGYAADPVIDALFGAGGRAPDINWLSDDARDACVVAAAAQPMMDLRSGRWAVKPRRSWDGAVLLWIKRLALALLGLTILIFAVQMARLGADRARADQAVMDMAQRLKINAPDAASAEAEMDRQLMARGGGPLAFSVPASALYAALVDAPAVSLKSLSYRSDGTLNASLAGPRVEDLNPVLLALQAKGYRITAQPMAGHDGQQMANITIRAVP